MKKLLVTGGTVFVSRFIAEYFVSKGDDVYVLNRNTREQSKGVYLINADRHYLGNQLKEHRFDAVIDVNAYNAHDINTMLDSLGDFHKYIFISSSAVYPDYAKQPFDENTETGLNRHWGKYGIEKIEAESALLTRLQSGYIIRPPYLYGPMNNLYRESFVFDCAMQKRPFYLPAKKIDLQFFHVKDLCKLIEKIINSNTAQHIINVGNETLISSKHWVEMCYNVVGEKVNIIEVGENVDIRSYFCFRDYEYALNVDIQNKLIAELIPIKKGLEESFAWYIDNKDLVLKKPYMFFIDEQLQNTLHNR